MSFCVRFILFSIMFCISHHFALVISIEDNCQYNFFALCTVFNILILLWHCFLFPCIYVLYILFYVIGERAEKNIFVHLNCYLKHRGQIFPAFHRLLSFEHQNAFISFSYNLPETINDIYAGNVCLSVKSDIDLIIW